MLEENIFRNGIGLKRAIRAKALFTGISALIISGNILAQVLPDGPAVLPGSLKDTPVPPVPGLEKFIRDKAAAVALGKALFWDQNAGTGGVACASCHFHAGTDNRMKNQLHPGSNGVFDQPLVASAWGPNHTLMSADFPLHKLADTTDRNSAILSSTNDVVGSAGMQSGTAMSLIPKVGVNCKDRLPGDVFHVNGKMTRLTTGRNAPTVINAVFNFRNFWDGRANNIFNGVNPFGPRDPAAGVFERQPDGSEKFVQVSLINSSLASQAVGPALNTVEMTCALKGFMELGRKMYSLRPLASQTVAVDDSVLAPYRYPTGAGLSVNYAALVKKAFDPRYWSSSKVDASGYTQFERNFSLFWGLAIQAYESTLVSDDTPYDRFIGSTSAGIPPNPNELNMIVAANGGNARRGLDVFMGKGKCINCHKGAEFTGAATLLLKANQERGLVEHMIMGDGRPALYDDGFYNIGVRPTAEDLGVGARDPFGNPLSWTRQYANAGFPANGINIQPDRFQIDPCTFETPVNPSNCAQPPSAGTRDAVDGAFKTPTLRNVALTAPYFHNGGTGTLEQVVEFYNRGGDRRGPDGSDTTGFGANGSNLDPDIVRLNLTDLEKKDLVAFLRYALTDRRVACESAPFDHPSLTLANGHVGNDSVAADADGNGFADDDRIVLPATGRGGLPAASRFCYTNDVNDIVSASPQEMTDILMAGMLESPLASALGLGLLGIAPVAAFRSRSRPGRTV